jgi:hypothetical protein
MSKLMIPAMISVNPMYLVKQARAAEIIISKSHLTRPFWRNVCNPIKNSSEKAMNNVSVQAKTDIVMRRLDEDTSNVAKEAR